MRIFSGQALQKSLSGLVTQPLSGQVMHASGLTENVIRIVLLKTVFVREQGCLMALWAAIQPSTVRACILFLNVPFIYLTHVLQASLCRIQMEQFSAGI